MPVHSSTPSGASVSSVPSVPAKLTEVPRSPQGEGSSQIPVITESSQGSITSNDGSPTFDGSSQNLYIEDGDQTGLDVTGNHTLELWAKLTGSVGDGNNVALISKHDPTNDQQGYELFINDPTGAGNQTLRLTISEDADGTTSQTVNTTFNMKARIWTHLAVTCDFDNDQIIFYINGIKMKVNSTGSVSSIYNNTANFTIGSGSEGDRYFPGNIQMVRVFTTVRTQAQIIADMRATTLSNSTGLVGFWPLQNSAFLDLSGNNNTLSSTGSPTVDSTEKAFSTYGYTTRYTAGTADGWIQSALDTSWDTVHDATDGASVVNTAGTSESRVQILTFPTRYRIFRAFETFDTSGLGGTTPLDATLFFKTHTVSGNTFEWGIVETTQADNTTLGTEDYDQCGSVNSPTELATRVAGSNLGDLTEDASNEQHTPFHFNSSGVAAINSSGTTALGIRTEFDLDDGTPSSNHYFIFYSADSLGTTSAGDASDKPFLDVIT